MAKSFMSFLCLFLFLSSLDVLAVTKKKKVALQHQKQPLQKPETIDFWMHRLEQKYRSRKTMQADFQQIYYDTLRNKRFVESGRLWSDAHSRVRWTYEKPQKKDFLYDGQQAFFYEPEAAQVTVFNDLGSSPLRDVLALLTGRQTMVSRFDAAFCETACFEQLSLADLQIKEEDLLVFQLTAHAGDLPQLQSIQLFVQRSTIELLACQMDDSIGHHTIYLFSNRLFNQPLSENRFQMLWPEDIRVLKEDGFNAYDSNASKVPSLLEQQAEP